MLSEEIVRRVREELNGKDTQANAVKTLLGLVQPVLSAAAVASFTAGDIRKAGNTAKLAKLIGKVIA
jgi:hypothetical protein